MPDKKFEIIVIEMLELITKQNEQSYKALTNAIEIELITKQNEQSYKALTKHIASLSERLSLITKKINHMSDNTNQALHDLDAINTQLQKIGNETSVSLQKIIDLENTANANPDTPPEVLAKIADVKAQAQIVDDLTPDAAEPTPPENV